MAEQNGRLPDSVLAPIKGGRLEKQAAAALNAANVEARKVGIELLPTGSQSSYRDYAAQEYFYRTMPRGMAARPGTSDHGWGRAIDLKTPAMQAWMRANGQRFGWHPDGLSFKPTPEPWHFVWRPGVWSGPDPGPDGKPPTPEQPEPTEEEQHMRLAIAYEADGRVHMARIAGRDAKNTIEHQWMQKDGKWSGWHKIPAADGRTRPWVSVQFARHKDGRLELFAQTDADTVWRVHQTGPNAGWAPRFVKA